MSTHKKNPWDIFNVLHNISRNTFFSAILAIIFFKISIILSIFNCFEWPKKINYDWLLLFPNNASVIIFAKRNYCIHCNNLGNNTCYNNKCNMKKHAHFDDHYVNWFQRKIFVNMFKYSFNILKTGKDSQVPHLFFDWNKIERFVVWLSIPSSNRSFHS